MIMNSYVQARSTGKWHLSTEHEPAWGVQAAACGVTLDAINVTWNEAPPCLPRDVCQRCTRANRRA